MPRKTAAETAADIIETAALTGLGLSDWLDPAYAEPMRPQETAGGQVCESSETEFRIWAGSAKLVGGGA